MPRWACRIVLKVEDVRVERVQDISEKDAMAEGVTPGMVGACNCKGEPTHPYQPHIISFVDLWDSIYATRGLGWKANPWVWALTFSVAASTNQEAQKLLAMGGGE